jgi:voltage-gated potassium channel
MLVLCLWALSSLGIGTIWRLDPEIQQIIDYADVLVCVLFFVDFLASLKRAPRKWVYLASWGWIDLLSSIPTIDALRWGRAARLLRILRVLRGVKSARSIAHFVAERRAQSAFLATALLSLLLLVFAAIAVLQFETGPDSNIRTAEDALWWAVSTMTTVGYGDTYPVTPEGRLAAVFLMAAGVGLFGTFSGLVASWFLSPVARETDSDIEDLKALVADIRRRLPPVADGDNESRQ